MKDDAYAIAPDTLSDDASMHSAPTIRREINMVRWHVMRVSYHRERKVYDYLTAQGIECYLPKKLDITYNETGARQVREVDVLPNILFVKQSRHELYQLKRILPYDIPLHYFCDRTKPGNPPLVIPDKMMSDFICHTTQRPESFLWLDHPADVFVKGKRVRVVHGPLAGCEGYVMRVKRNLRFVLSLEGLVSAAVMTTECQYDWLEPID